MNAENFSRLVAQCQPHPVFNLEWSTYGTLDFADTFLPNTPEYKGTAFHFFDGAELLLNAEKVVKKLFQLKSNNSLTSTVFYTYPKGVEAEKKRKNIQVEPFAVCAIIEVYEDDNIDVLFKFGGEFVDFLRNQMKENKMEELVKSIEDKIYQSTIQDFQKFFGNEVSHYNMLSWVLTTCGIQILSETDKPKFTRGYWTNSKGNLITSALVFDVVYFNIETRNINVGEIVFISLYDDDTIVGLEKADNDEHIKLVKSGEQYLFDKVDKNGAIRIALRLGSLEPFFKNDEDKVLELYFRCSYKNLHVELPFNEKEYLRVIGLPLLPICIDRYKMPGLNLLGTELADDMAYGYGVKSNYDFHKEIEVYKKEYEENGFNIGKHFLFANEDEEFDEKSNPKEEVGKKNKEEPPLDEVQPIEIDNTYVDIPIRYLLPKPITANCKKAKYNKSECYNTTFEVENTYLKKIIPEINTGLKVRHFDKFSDEYIFWDFEQTATLLFARGEMQDVLKDMIAKFKRNEGGIYENPLLTKVIKDNKNTLAYCQSLQDYMAEKLKTAKGNLKLLEDKEAYFQIQDRLDKDKHFTRPAFGWRQDGNVLRGETITLNDIWATEVFITDYHRTEEDYTIKYTVTLWDHFGLDIPDMEKIFNVVPSANEAFACWFVLQHLRGYKPFITKITFEQEFKGNLSKGKKEREAERKEAEKDIIKISK